MTQDLGKRKNVKEKVTVEDCTTHGECSNTLPLNQEVVKEYMEGDTHVIMEEEMMMEDYPFSKDLVKLVSTLEK